MQFVRVFVYAGAAASWIWSAAAQIQYSSDGTPTGVEEEIRWRVNRGRFDSASENALRGTAYTNVPASSGPLAPSQSLTLAARHQSEDMAKANLFQHATVPGSLYYNPTTQPNPWDRMLAEGYSWNNAGENIAAGYSGAEAVYVGWWNSSGHRVNMYNSALREIGNGYYYWSSATYRNYYTMDLGSSGSTCFFTDTLFNDLNGNGTYEQNEGVQGIAVLLTTGTSSAPNYDLSSSVGSFAIPIQSFPGGATVQVVLSNTTPTNVTLTVPRDFRQYSTVSLGPNQSVLYGTFVRPSSTGNVGLRNVTVAPAALVSPRLTIACSQSSAQLFWTSSSNCQYQPQWSTDLVVWNNLTNGFLPATGGEMTYSDDAPGAGQRFYRLAVVRQP